MPNLANTDIDWTPTEHESVYITYFMREVCAGIRNIEGDVANFLYRTVMVSVIQRRDPTGERGDVVHQEMRQIVQRIVSMVNWLKNTHQDKNVRNQCSNIIDNATRWLEVL